MLLFLSLAWADSIRLSAPACTQLLSGFSVLSDDGATYLRLLDLTLKGIDEAEAGALSQFNRESLKLRLLQVLETSQIATNPIAELQKLAPDFAYYSPQLIALVQQETLAKLVTDLADVDWTAIRQAVTNQLANLRNLQTQQVSSKNGTQEDYLDAADAENENRLHREIRAKQWQTVLLILQHRLIDGGYINQSNNKRQTPLDVFNAVVDVKPDSTMGSLEKTVFDRLVEKRALTHATLTKLEKKIRNAACHGPVDKIAPIYNRGVGNLDVLLDVAVRCNNIRAIRRLLAMGADVNAVSADAGQTILARALKYGKLQVKTLKYLFKKRPEDLKTQLLNEQKALPKVVSEGRIDLIELFSQMGLQVDQYRNLNGGNLLHELGHFKPYALIDSLVRLGVQIDAYNSLGFTPLMSAIQRDNREAVMAFLKAGANYHLRTHDQSALTALEYAEKLGKRKIADTIKDFILQNEDLRKQKNP